MGSTDRATVAVAAAAAVLVLGGSAVVATAEPASFGWFAYAPAPPSAPAGAVLLGPRQLAGAVVVVVGLLGAAVGGHAVGRRRRGAAAPRP